MHLEKKKKHASNIFQNLLSEAFINLLSNKRQHLITFTSNSLYVSRQEEKLKLMRSGAVLVTEFMSKYSFLKKCLTSNDLQEKSITREGIMTGFICLFAV